MGFLFCPWLRWGRRHSTSPNDTSCYQLTRLESLSPVEEQAEGVSWSADNDITHEHKRRSSGLSDRLRRRFSKETNTGPKNADRKFRGSFLPFTHKPTNPSPGLIASGDFPSSLMSDRGYDSDAQFMGTPRKVNNTTENLYNNPSIWGSISPLAQPYYETEPDEPGEEVAEESRITVDGPFLGRNDMETSQLPWHPRDYPGWGVPPPITHSADYGRARKRVGSPYTSGFFDNPGRYSTFTNRGRRMGYPGRASISPVPHAPSVDSLYGPSSQLSIRKRRPPPPREPKSESHSVHLGEMDISKRLVSPSISPHVLSEKTSFDGNGSNNTGTRNVSHQLHDPTNLVTAQTPARDAHESDQVTSKAQVSSSYSRRTSFSSGFSKYHFETKIFNLPESVREPIKNPYAGASSLSPSFQSQETSVVSLNNLTTPSACDTTECAQQSKSPEQREVDPLVASTRADSQSNPSMALSSPRQVSVGWMSGGRRLGYGYTLVPADEDGGKLATGDTCSLKTSHLNSAATTGEGDTKASSSHVDKPCMGQNNKMILWKGEPIFEISNMMHRLNLRHWSGATTSSGANNASEGTSNCSVTSVLWGKLGYPRKSQNEPETQVGQKPPWSHFCGVGLDQALDGTQSPLKSSPTPTSGTEEQLSRGRAGLHRARSLWTKSRTITDRAHSLETKFATKIPISIKQRSDLQQRKKTRVIRLKARDRKKTINSLDEEKPILPISGQQDNPALPRTEEGQKSNLDHYRRIYGTLQETERNSSDTDLADAYEDCLEVCSIP